VRTVDRGPAHHYATDAEMAAALGDLERRIAETRRRARQAARPHPRFAANRL
jgi:hypothetical protein